MITDNVHSRGECKKTIYAPFNEPYPNILSSAGIFKCLFLKNKNIELTVGIRLHSWPRHRAKNKLQSG